MSVKLPEISKNIKISGTVLLLGLLFKSFFSLNQFSLFRPECIPYLLIYCIPFTIFICSKLSPDAGKDLKAVDIIALIGIIYTLVVVLDNTVIRYPVMITVGVLCIALILSQNVYTLIAAAGICLVASFSPQFGQAGPICASSVICASMVRFSYLFPKKSKVSAKKARKSVPETASPDCKKEKIFFIVSQIILFAAFAVSIHYRKNTIALITFMSNLKYIIPAAIVAAALFALAVMSIKNKRAFIEVIGYVIAIVAMPFSLLSEYSVAALGVAGGMYLMLSLCDGKAMLPAGEYAEKIYYVITAKINKKSKSAEEA